MFENNSNTCRICLESNSSKEIFETMANGDVVANLLIDLAGIEVLPADPHPMPRHICDTCYSNLIKAYGTRKQIRDSDNLLREMYDIRINDDNGAKVQLKTEHDLSFSIEYIKTEAVHEEAVTVVEPIVLPVERTETSEDEIEVNVLLSQQTLEVPIEPPSTETTDYNCCMCPEHFDDFELLKQHALDKHNKQWQPIDIPKRRGLLKEGAQCDLCGRKYNTAARLRQHKIHYKVMVACDVCGAMVPRYDIPKHKWTHNEDEVECEFCHKKYKKIYIREHRNKVHILAKQFKCDLCPKEFPFKNLLKRHKERRHDPNYKAPIKATCTICHHEFQSRAGLRSHMFIHSGQKRYSCEHCTVSFMHRTDWLRHTWSHIGSPYSCSKCNKYMDRPSQLQAHQAAGCGNQVHNARPRSTTVRAKRKQPSLVITSESGSNNDESSNAV